MAKQHLLTPSERKAFQLPPIFQPDKKAAYFEINQSIQKWLDTLNSPYRKVGFVLQWGYFRRVGRFFSSQLFHKQDILFVKQLLGLAHSTLKCNVAMDNGLSKEDLKGCFVL